MRKLLALLLLVAVVTSAFAFANSFDVNSLPEREGQQNISSGAATVQHCIGDLDVDIRGGDFVPSLGDFEVATVLLRANADCAGDSVKVTFTNGDGEPIVTIPGRLNSSGNANLDVASNWDVRVSEVANIHVLIEANAPSTRE
jgi:hypothetical protein